MHRLPILLSICLVALLCLQSGCKSGKRTKDPIVKEEPLPPHLEKAYREDAARLTVREILTTASTGERSADLPADRVKFFYDVLGKIYRLTLTTDSIPDISHIHTLKTPSLKEVLVILEKDSPFETNWSKGMTSTSNLYVNQLISKYKLRIKNYRKSALGPTLVFESRDFINTTELAFLLTQVDGIRHAEAEGIAGDGNNIEWGSDSKNRMAMKYSVGAGDCPSGCIYRKYWIFYVGPQGELDYMGTRGSIPDDVED